MGTDDSNEDDELVQMGNYGEEGDMVEYSGFVERQRYGYELPQPELKQMQSPRVFVNNRIVSKPLPPVR